MLGTNMPAPIKTSQIGFRVLQKAEISKKKSFLRELSRQKKADRQILN